MWNNKTVAVIFPTYREKRSIKNSIIEFDSTGFIDEIIVVDNNAETGTSEEVKKTRARTIKEPIQGYGAAIKTGIKSTNADILLIAEPDGTFDGNDVVKFLAYSDDFDMVFGSRTHVPLIHKKAGMTFQRRIADVILGKLISLLFLCPPNATVYISAIPDPYFVFKERNRNNLIYEYPIFPTSKESLLKVLDNTDYIIFNSPLESIVVGDLVSPYITSNAEEVIPLNLPFQYEVFIVKLKPKDERVNE